MKKNFLKVAALLIAAMLMVVSCTQEVAPVDNGLVEVTLNTSAARSALTYSGLDIGDVSYSYKLNAKWNPSEGQDAVVGDTGINYVPYDGEDVSLGFVSQGLWEVDVIGTIDGKNVLHGNTQVYFNKTKSDVTVYVKPIETAETAGISLDVKVNDHDVDATNYKLYFTIVGVSGNSINGKVGNEETAKALTEVEMTKGSLDSNLYRTWTASVTGLTPGYYRVTVSMKNSSGVVGGITKGVLLFAGDTGENGAKLTGSVNSMDFVNGTLNIVYPTVTLSLSSKVDDAEITETVTGKKVVYTANSTIDSSSLPSGSVGAATYTWYENGTVVESNQTAAFEKTYTTPGYKTVTCVVTYTLNIPNNNNGNTNNTDKVSFTVQVDEGKTVKVTSAN